MLVYGNLGSFPGGQAWMVETVHLMDVHANLCPVTSVLSIFFFFFL